MDKFEELLNQRFPNGTNGEEIFMNEWFTFGDGEGLKPDGSVKDLQFANGNAQLRDFFKMVGFICESAMEDRLDIQYIPYEQALIYRRDPDHRLNKNTVAYRVLNREHTEGKGYKMRDTSSLLDEDEQHHVTRYTEYFTSSVEFRFMSMNYDDAHDMMDQFEDIMNAYYRHIRSSGIVDYWFEEQVTSDPDIDFREVMIVFVLHYIVKTERNIVITNEGITNINVLGAIVHDRGNNNKKEEN